MARPPAERRGAATGPRSAAPPRRRSSSRARRQLWSSAGGPRHRVSRAARAARSPGRGEPRAPVANGSAPLPPRVLRRWCGKRWIAADDIAAKVRHSDTWFVAMAGSPRRARSCSATSGYLRPCCRAACCRGTASPRSLSCCVCGYQRHWSTWPVVGAVTDWRSPCAGRFAHRPRLSAEAIRQADQYADSLARDACFVVADIAATGLRTASVDAVMCIDAVHIVPEPADVFGELRRVLRPGGRAVVSTGRRGTARTTSCRSGSAGSMVPPGSPPPGSSTSSWRSGRLWEQRERTLWAEAAILDPAGDDAVASLRAEAIEVMPHVPLTRRVLASATAAQPVAALTRVGRARLVNLRILGVRRPRCGPTGRSCRTAPA